MTLESLTEAIYRAIEAQGGFINPTAEEQIAALVDTILHDPGNTEEG
jgi:hypothetical protein